MWTFILECVSKVKKISLLLFYEIKKVISNLLEKKMKFIFSSNTQINT